ncbi:MAG TPA: type II toxin-antitoxin system PemK/MazF family toxin [Nocardioides sp.]|nr:type II toxin-antitoxin system PemK/MazF family toxin [Nocardioides sp.]
MSIGKRIRAFLSGTSAPGTSTSGSTPPPAASQGSYAPERDGEPDPGEVVWAWVPYEDDPSQGKDRPVLVLDTAGDGEGDGEGDGWVGLMLSSQDHDRDAADEARWGRHWMDVGTGGWDSQGRPSEVRLDRLIHLRRGAVRREGAALDETIFTAVVEARRGLSG